MSKGKVGFTWIEIALGTVMIIGELLAVIWIVRRIMQS